jgi:hypothetical protein
VHIQNDSGLYIVALISKGYAPTEPVLSSEEKMSNPDYSSYYFANASEQQDILTGLNFVFVRIGQTANDLGNATVSSNITTSQADHANLLSVNQTKGFLDKPLE